MGVGCAALAQQRRRRCEPVARPCSRTCLPGPRPPVRFRLFVSSLYPLSSPNLTRRSYCLRSTALLRTPRRGSTTPTSRLSRRFKTNQLPFVPSPLSFILSPLALYSTLFDASPPPFRVSISLAENQPFFLLSTALLRTLRCGSTTPHLASYLVFEELTNALAYFLSTRLYYPHLACLILLFQN